jgi:hypothetical protein
MMLRKNGHINYLIFFSNEQFFANLKGGNINNGFFPIFFLIKF